MTFSIEDGGFAYSKKSPPVLKNISFQAGPGDIVAVLGPNGCGKTTLLRCAVGFLRWGRGKSAIDGVSIRSMPHRELWRRVAYVPQARGAVSACTVEESAALGRGARLGPLSRPGAADVLLVRSVLERLGIGHLAEKKCTEISGGELQMTLIARALCAEPGILILDEPESNLDFKNQLLVLNIITELAKSGMTCIFNTHYPAHALQRANKALLFTGGGQAVFGETAEIITEDSIRRAFGVRAVIGDIKTPGGVLRDVLPVEIDE